MYSLLFGFTIKKMWNKINQILTLKLRKLKKRKTSPQIEQNSSWVEWNCVKREKEIHKSILKPEKRENKRKIQRANRKINKNPRLAIRKEII